MVMRSFARQYDVALLGATGFTATFVAQIFATTLPTEAHWLIAGRSSEKLKGLRQKLRQLSPKGPVPGMRFSQPTVHESIF